MIPFIMTAAVVLATAQPALISWSPANVVAIAVAALGLAGTVTVAVIQARSRKQTDARDDRSAENATLKGAAEVAMELVDKTKSWAMDLINAMQKQIDDQKETIADLRAERRRLLDYIAELEAGGAGSSVAHVAELAAAHAREEELRVKVAEKQALIARLEESLREAEEYGVDELTLNPLEVQKRASVFEPPV